ncbi:MAG: DUF2087 domain-containing protein [Anaerolineales bacterium]|nr:MAG: DUF2087 domain-containing protein [Anaerolineales bacterium]
MDTPPQVMDFVKAMASAERLRVIGVLARGRATQAEIAEQLHIPARDAFDHLAFLVEVGVVTESDGVYDLNEKAIESLARGQFEGKRPIYEAKEEKQEDVRKVLKIFLNADGTIKQIPLEDKKLVVILNYVLPAFALDATYTEKEVNTLLRRFHTDTATLRRAFIDQGLLARESDGSKYWRVKNG